MESESPETELLNALRIPLSDKSQDTASRHLKGIVSDNKYQFSSTSEFLQSDEAVTCGICCSQIKDLNTSYEELGPRGFLWCTTSRILFVYNSGNRLLANRIPHFLQFDYKSLATIAHRQKGIFRQNRIVLHVSTVSSGGRVNEIHFVPDVLYNEIGIVQFVKVAQELKLEQLKPTPVSREDITKDSSSSTQKLLELLERLHLLHQQNALSDEEFMAAKKKLLGL